MFDDNTNTVSAIDRIYEEDSDSWENNLFDSTEYAMELDKRNPVIEGICKYLKLDENDPKVIKKELNKKYKEIGISGGIPKSVENWISGKKANPAYRANLYNLCLALGLDLGETTEFFLKYFLTIPFNYKDRVDAIYFYGIRHNLSYLEIRTILDEFEDYEETHGSPDEITEAIGGHIEEIDDISIFKEFLLQHTYSRSAQFNTATNEIIALIQKNGEYAETERWIRPEETGAIDYLDNVNEREEIPIIRSDGRKNPINISRLLSVMYGYENQKQYINRQTKISKSDKLPKAFRENFPNEEELSRIMHRDASPDVYRKALIMLRFYNYFAHSFITYMYGKPNPSKSDKIKRTLADYVERDMYEIIGEMEDFKDETGKILAKCGFVQMYARNPFDWLILYCAKSSDPLGALRSLLNERYLNVYEN